MHTTHPTVSPMVEAARMRQLAALEEILSDHLFASGLSPEAARTSAVSFVTQTAMHFAAA